MCLGSECQRGGLPWFGSRFSWEILSTIYAIFLVSNSNFSGNRCQYFFMARVCVPCGIFLKNLLGPRPASLYYQELEVFWWYKFAIAHRTSLSTAKI